MGFGDGGGGRRGRLAILAAGLAGALIITGCGSHRRPVAAAPRPTATAVAAVSPVTVPAPVAAVSPVTVPAPPVGSILVAATHGSVPMFAAPEGPQSGTVPATWYGYPTVLPVIDESPGWVQVRLAQRPNQASAWVPMADVNLTSTPYRIVIDVASDRLQVFQSGAQIMDFPAGVGTTDNPTVTGHYFMTMQVPPPTPAYGPFVLVTSAHSNSITDWEDSGDAIIAIHGPIDAGADNEIGSTGAKISHGCVRLHDADLARLSVIPAGTPIDIVAGH